MELATRRGGDDRLGSPAPTVIGRPGPLGLAIGLIGLTYVLVLVYLVEVRGANLL
jgi:hypothetical protein